MILVYEGVKKKWKQLLQNMVNSNLNNPKEMLVQTHFNAVLSQTTTVLHIGEMWEIIMQNTKKFDFYYFCRW